MATELTIGIPTCARPDKIRACVESIQRHVEQAYTLIIVDSQITESNRRFYQSIKNARCIPFEQPISPSAARRVIAENTETPYLLYLDDDIEVTPGGVAGLRQHLERHPETGIVAAAWKEYGRYRSLGQRFNFGMMDDRRVIHRTYLPVEEFRELGITSVRADAVLASMLLRTSVFEKATFDPQYDFFFELFDFFMQCRAASVVVEALPEVVFEHRPTRYRARTLQQDNRREVDLERFARKWGATPIRGSGEFRPSWTTRLRRSSVRSITHAFFRRLRKTRPIDPPV